MGCAPIAATALLLLAAGLCKCQMDSCNSDLSTFLPSPFNASGLHCAPIWNSFILRYSQDKGNTLSIVLSAVFTTGWVGLGFSSDGMMVGSSAMVGWVGPGGRAHIKQYYLRGQSTSQVIVDEGQLLMTNVAPAVVLYGDNIYLAFQLKFSAPVTKQELLFAYSTTSPNNYHLTEHDDKISISFDFTGGASSTPPDSLYPYNLKRNHGALAISGWGVLLPAGVVIARYFKSWEPLWYYLHVVVQFAGFLTSLAGVVSGIALYDQLHSDVYLHRGLGIFVFALGILQVIAFFVRPGKESKIRKHWNGYHRWVGRLALFLATVNIVLGIHVASAGPYWKAAYGISLCLILITTGVLEVMSFNRLSGESVSPPTY